LGWDPAAAGTGIMTVLPGHAVLAVDLWRGGLCAVSSVRWCGAGGSVGRRGMITGLLMCNEVTESRSDGGADAGGRRLH
jgi:hypothetical protein